MIIYHELFDAFERRADCRDLCQDIDAITIFFDHPGDSADLPFKAIETF
ncbi:hypothetical protein Z946_585 [Sulfitobacter noctilucicola]|nr:hypothetical protein Z946_585 [Sulfitobacter noctilucicola]